MFTAPRHLFFKIQSNSENIVTICSLYTATRYEEVNKTVITKDKFCELYNHTLYGSELDAIKKRWMLRKITALPLCFYNLALSITKLFFFAVTFPLTGFYFIDSSAMNYKYSKAYLSCLGSDCVGLYNLENVKFDDLFVGTNNSSATHSRRLSLLNYLKSPRLYSGDLYLDARTMANLWRVVESLNLIPELPANALRLLSEVMSPKSLRELPIEKVNDLDFTKLSENSFRQLVLHGFTNYTDPRKIRALNSANLGVCINRKFLHHAMDFYYITEEQFRSLNLDQLTDDGLWALFYNYVRNPRHPDFESFEHRFLLLDMKNHPQKALVVFRNLLEECSASYVGHYEINLGLSNFFIKYFGVEKLKCLTPDQLSSLAWKFSPDQLNLALDYIINQKFDSYWTREHVKRFLGFPESDEPSSFIANRLTHNKKLFDYLIQKNICSRSRLFRSLSFEQMPFFIKDFGVENLKCLTPDQLSSLAWKFSPDQLNLALDYIIKQEFDSYWTREHVKRFFGFIGWDNPSSFIAHKLILNKKLFDYLIQKDICSPDRLIRSLSIEQKSECRAYFVSYFSSRYSSSAHSTHAAGGAGYSYFSPGAGGAAGGAGYSYSSPGAGGATGGAGVSRAPSGPSFIGENYLDAIIKKTDFSPKTIPDALRLLCPALYIKYKGAEDFKLLPEEAKLLRKETRALQFKYHPDKIKRLAGESDKDFATRTDMMKQKIQQINVASDLIEEFSVLA